MNSGSFRAPGRLNLRDEAVNLAPLVAALLLADRVLVAAWIPGWAELAVLAVGAQAAAWRLGETAGPWRSFSARLPALAIVGAVAGCLFLFALKLPLATLTFIPVWLGLEAAYRVAWIGHRSALQAWWWRQLQARADRWWGAILLIGIMGWASGSFYPDFWAQLGTGSLSRAHGVVLAWTIAALASYGAALRAIGPKPEAAAENLRWMGIAAAGCFLFRGFFHFTLQGGGDANWYAMMLADAVAQARAGVFPIWAGQSIYQFNGAIYSLRVAPAFHYLGALLDTLTFRSLGLFALQNLLQTLLGLATVGTAYFTLGALLPGRRTLAAGLAVLFLACPGVFGLPYVADLFMSWTTAPWLPFVWFATVRSFRDGGAFQTMLLLGTALALCWWGHSPIALWTTLIAGGAQVLRLVLGPRSTFGSLLAGAGSFLAVAAYPIGSVLLFPPERALKAYDFQVATPGNIALFIREAFPACLLPVSYIARNLGDFQLGYALWAFLLFGLWHWRRARAPEARFLLVAAGLLIVLLTPVPGLDLALWTLVPAWVRNPTANWVMNRLYLVLAGVTVYGFAATVACGAFDETRRRRTLAVLAALGCCWSLAEGARFARSPVMNYRAVSSAVDLLRPENIAITRFSYLVFPHEPAYFTHGVADPAFESRLRRGPDGPVIADNLSAARAEASPVAQGDFAIETGTQALRVTAPFRLEPAQHYLLAFDFHQPTQTKGDLQLVGSSLEREYALPESGEPAAFGVGGRHAHALSLWTSDPAGENVILRFLPEVSPDGPAPDLVKLVPFAHATLLAYNPDNLPVRTFSWIPYRAHVNSPEAAWLETPRMYQDGYAAWVNGQPVTVRKSSEDLVAIPVPAGRAEVKIKYYPPPGLELLFWLSLGGMILCGGILLAKTIRHERGSAP